MGMNIPGFIRIKEDRKKLGFFKIFQTADLSSESMRAFPYKFIRKVAKKDFSYKMVLKAQWGTSWELEVSKNPRFYYMEKRGWDQFVSDNVLGRNEFITFTHKGKMRFNVNIYEQNGVEMRIPRKHQTMGSSSGIKKEQGESSLKDVKKEEETDESPGRFEVDTRKKKTERSNISTKKMKSKKVYNAVERGESSRGAELKARKKKKAELASTFKKKKKLKRKRAECTDREFRITIRTSYLKFLAIPMEFVRYIPNESTMFTIRHPNGETSWKVLCLVRNKRTIFSRGWSRMAREYPLLIGDICTFKLINPTELLLVISKKAKKTKNKFHTIIE
ncbi:B3 domain-containing protein [Cardamine amara subsp. amara]|uniref:B3 domain-containing protein n=1 Tax=Cardamine amara subsp. amara TaxID=228776 RepID=A0ABD1C2P3_CARAN